MIETINSPSNEAAIQKDPEIVRRAVVAGSASRSDIDNSENPFVAWDPDRLKVYMEELGFVVESIAYSELLPKLRTADEDMMQRLRTSYSKMIEWRLTAKKEKHNVDPDLPFNVVSEFKDGVFKASIQGRMDTITAPELMKKFNELPEKAEAIEIDAAKMAYIGHPDQRVGEANADRPRREPFHDLISHIVHLLWFGSILPAEPNTNQISVRSRQNHSEPCRTIFLLDLLSDT